MTFKPMNRYILLLPEEIEEEEKERSTILVPDDYKVKTSPYGLYKVLAIATDCCAVAPIANAP